MNKARNTMVNAKKESEGYCVHLKKYKNDTLLFKYVNTHRKIEKHTWERDSTSGEKLSPEERKGLGAGKGIKTRPHHVY